MELAYIPFEPAKENRFIVKFLGDLDNVPEYLFKSFYLTNEGNDFILKVEMYNAMHYVFNPKDLFKITSVEIEILDPVGMVPQILFLPVKGSNYIIKGNYKSDRIMISEFRFVIDGEKINLIYKNTIENGDSEGAC